MDAERPVGIPTRSVGTRTSEIHLLFIICLFEFARVYIMNKKLPQIIGEISLDAIIRIDVSLEGAWNSNLATIWSRKDGFTGFNGISRSHAVFKPSLELYFDCSWVGIHCFNRKGGHFVFDEELAAAIIDYIENRFG